ncbi:MAG: sulfotransferase [Rubrobacteraceae bacterium]|nr:sulfotransferase [Rubrobacteraceae bacterium]
MNLERILERLRVYRLQNERFDRLVGAVMANKLAARAVRASVSAATSVARPKGVSEQRYDTVFFVAGEMRSGTSWLRRTLSAHPEIACGHEGSFFGRDYHREEIPVYTGPVSSFTRALAVSEEFKVWHELPWNQWTHEYEEDLRNLTRLSIDYFLKKEVARTGKRIVGDKSPQHTGCLDEIHEIYPDARIIHIVRDGRDVAVSAMHHWWRLAKDQPGGVFELTPEELEIRDAYLRDREEFLASGRSIFTEERLSQLARRWGHRVGKARRDGSALYGERYLEIRYEDLLRNTPDSFRRILGLLGARREDRIIERCIQASSFERVSNRRQGEEDSGSFFRKGVAGDWKGVFTERDREIYEELAGDQLIELGYGYALDE